MLYNIHAFKPIATISSSRKQVSFCIFNADRSVRSAGYNSSMLSGNTAGKEMKVDMRETYSCVANQRLDFVKYS